MIETVETHEFSRWFDGLKDDRAVARIRRRLYELVVGHAGDVKPVGAGVSELRIDYSPGRNHDHHQQKDSGEAQGSAL